MHCRDQAHLRQSVTVTLQLFTSEPHEIRGCWLLHIEISREDTMGRPDAACQVATDSREEPKAHVLLV